MKNDKGAASEAEPKKAPLPAALVKGLAAAGYKESDIHKGDGGKLAVSSYEKQKIYTVVTKEGQQLEISYDGKLLKGCSIAKRKAAAAEAAKKKKPAKK